MSDLLHVKDLEKHYDGFTLSCTDLAVPAGTVVGFIGSNGAGKTTTIKSILGLVRPDGGSIRLFGEDILGAPPSRLAELKQRIGVVFDTCSFPEEMSIEAVGRLMASCYQNWKPSAFQTLSRAFGLPSDKTVKDLSRGMGMKLSLACALAHNPDLLILDEATAGLDPLARDEALGMLRMYMNEEGHGILMSSHITSDLEKIADYIVCIDEGHIVFSVETDAITDLAGIAKCSISDFEALAASDFFKPGEMRYERSAYGVSVLVPDRMSFSARFPNIVLDRADIDSYLAFLLKGETR